MKTKLFKIKIVVSELTKNLEASDKFFEIDLGTLNVSEMVKGVSQIKTLTIDRENILTKAKIDSGDIYGLTLEEIMTMPEVYFTINVIF